MLVARKEKFHDFLVPKVWNLNVNVKIKSRDFTHFAKKTFLKSNPPSPLLFRSTPVLDSISSLVFCVWNPLIQTASGSNF